MNSSAPIGNVKRAPTARIRVLIVLDSFSFGGAENLVAELGSHAPESLQLSVASLAPASQNRDALFNRLAEAGLRPTHLSVHRLFDPLGFAKLVRTLRHANVDLVHAHLDYSAILVPLAARLVGKPVVATLHVNPRPHTMRREWLKERLSVRIPARLGRVVFVSHHSYEEFAQEHGPARHTWRVICNGVNLDRYTVAQQMITARPPTWAVIAALRPDKNHVDLIRAWVDVVAVQPQATLLIVGDGPSRNIIERAVADAGLEGSIRMLGERDDVPDVLQTVDGVVSASMDEALPTALIEAGASGLPVVAADAGGTREIVVDGVTGRLVSVGDTRALAEALLDVIADPAKAAAYGAAGRRLAEAKYSQTKWISKLEDLYAEVSGARR
jgi:glycosyltransferase involved in cell wall biosynthesis